MYSNHLCKFLVVRLTALSILIAYSALASITPSSWITITAFYDDSCSENSNIMASYACDVCLSSKSGAFYKMACSETSGIIQYQFTNYTSSDCAVGNEINTEPMKSFIPSMCTTRSDLGNVVSSMDFDTPRFYPYAKYTFTDGSKPPSLPYTGYLKKTYGRNNSSCSMNDLVEIKQFNEKFCYIINEKSSATFNCDGTVTYYSDNVCLTPKRVAPIENPSNECLPAIIGNGASYFYSCYTQPSLDSKEKDSLDYSDEL